MLEAAQKKEKQEWTIEKPKIDNARRLRGICFIDPEDEVREKLEVSMEAAVPCKVGTRKCSKRLQQTAGETAESSKQTKHACVVD